MTEVNLQQIIADKLSDEPFDLPVVSPTALELQRLMASPKCELSDLARVIRSDQSLAVKVLNLANSPFFSGLREIQSIEDAIVRVGMKEIFVLVVTLAQKNLYRSSNKYYGSLMQKLWEHSLGTAMACRWLSSKINCRDKADSLFMGGLLHDIGKLVLLKIVEEVGNGDEKSTVRVSESLMEEMLASMHTNVGATLLEKQKLPGVFCRMAQDHHLEDDDEDEAMDILKTANLLCHKIGIGLAHDPELRLTGTVSAERLGLTDIDIAELEVSLEGQMEELNQRIG